MSIAYVVLLVCVNNLVFDFFYFFSISGSLSIAGCQVYTRVCLCLSLFLYLFVSFFVCFFTNLFILKGVIIMKRTHFSQLPAVFAFYLIVD